MNLTPFQKKLLVHLLDNGLTLMTRTATRKRNVWKTTRPFDIGRHGMGAKSIDPLIDQHLVELDLENSFATEKQYILTSKGKDLAHKLWNEIGPIRA